jgi:hypothetical protein
VRSALALTIVLGCTRPTPERAIADQPTVKPAPAPRFVDLEGTRLEVVPFAPSRYANRTDVSVHATREGTTIENTTGRASFVLAFATEGTVTGCRGQHVDSSVDGPKSSHSTRFEEQQGYSGKWSTSDEVWVDVELTVDNARCKRVRRYTNLEPATWFLRCVSVVRGGALTMPALACRAAAPMKTQFSETSLHTLRKILPGEWLVLGAGNGLKVSWGEEGIGLYTEKEAVVTVSAAESPITESSWEK